MQHAACMHSYSSSHITLERVLVTTTAEPLPIFRPKMQAISCYEKLRLQNIERNLNFLKELGLDTTVTTVPASKASRQKRKIEFEEPSGDFRRSSRVASLLMKVSYKEVGEILTFVW